MVYTTSTGAAGGTIYRIETYDGSSWALDKGVYPYIAALNYPIEVIVTKDDKLYQSNAIIPANTAFTIGTSLATWKQIADNSIPNWIDGGFLTIGATTTAPTRPPTRYADKVYYKQIGPKTWQVEMIYRQDYVTGATSGTGDYLISLPNGLQFDTTILTQEAYTDNVQGNSGVFISKMLPNSSVHFYTTTGYWSGYISGIIPFDSNKFRVLIYSTGLIPWGSTWFSLNSFIQELRISFTFQSAN